MSERREETALDRRLRAHYGGLAPDAATLDVLVDRPAATRLRTAPARRSLGWAVAASALVLATLLVHLSSSLGERTVRVVREAAMNHNTRLSLEFDESSLASLNGAMGKLPFEIRRPARIGESWMPLGGRYCSLAGHLAAHVKLASPDGQETMSLFVTREAVDLERLDGRHRGVDGVDIELWDEHGLFYAMARSSS